MLTVREIKAAPAGRYGDAGGLSLIKTSQDSGKWNFRYSFLRTRRNMGLGSWPEVGLADARRERDRWAAVLRAGRDPITERKEERAATKAQRDNTDPTFAEMAQLVFEARKATLRGGGERGRWFSPLERHVLPHIGKMRVSEITPQDIKGALAPIWRTKFPTAEKALQRTRIVLHEGRLMGFGCDPFSAEAAQRMLGAVIHTPKHIPATPWQDMPALYARLNAGTVGHECLRFMMLTLVRYMGCAGARAAEVDGDVWTVPPERMKGTLKHVREFRVPLTDPALVIVQRQKEAFGDILFTGGRSAPITSAAIEKALRVLKEDGRPHGFRSSFRMWVQDTDACSFDVAETILGHTVGGRIERTYARSDLLERRRPVMEAWARYVTGSAENVVSSGSAADG
ncbi:tyrosine-type recombinase/integrase [Rhodovulum sulfidophilum]|uniref:tyrosine-type recombinase/integrase n=1 Tax=Rhodovulum sulfidophilum TaxID=35806 RepID=UPI001F4602F1|nr:integrase arm-type DNA-binding domain-containing protein [Rhodovulum sulfidophilum]